MKGSRLSLILVHLRTSSLGCVAALVRFRSQPFIQLAGYLRLSPPIQNIFIVDDPQPAPYYNVFVSPTPIKVSEFLDLPLCTLHPTPYTFASHLSDRESPSQ